MKIKKNVNQEYARNKSQVVPGSLVSKIEMPNYESGRSAGENIL
mgnify:CR=1